MLQLLSDLSCKSAVSLIDASSSGEFPNELYQKLCAYIASLNSVVVSCSGGVDSSLLMKVARDTLHENAVPVMVLTEVTIKREFRAASALCDSLGASLNVINLSLLPNNEHNSVNGSVFSNNPPNRCYICKYAMFTAIRNFATERGITCIIEGTNASDCLEDRPGFAAITELSVISPLRECGLTKTDVRTISRRLALETWDAPSNSCLATRFAYGQVLTKEKLELVEKAEDFLVSNGIEQVRVRVGDYTS